MVFAHLLRVGGAFRGPLPLRGVPSQGGGVRIGRGRMGRAVRGGAAAGHGAGRGPLQRPQGPRAARAKAPTALRTHVPSLH